MRKPSIARTSWAVALATAALFAPASGQEVPTVAVMDLGSFMMGEGGTSVEIGKALSAMLVSELSDRSGIRVVDRAQLHTLLQDQELDFHGRIEESDAIAVGRMLGVEYVVHGQVTSIVDNLRIDVRAVDVSSAEILFTLKRSTKTTDIGVLVIDMTDEFVQGLSLGPPPERRQVGPIPVEATIAFSHGVGFEDRGERDFAIERYEAVLRIHPSHRDARRALQRLLRGT